MPKLKWRQIETKLVLCIVSVIHLFGYESRIFVFVVTWRALQFTLSKSQKLYYFNGIFCTAVCFTSTERSLSNALVIVFQTHLHLCTLCKFFAVQGPTHLCPAVLKCWNQICVVIFVSVFWILRASDSPSCVVFLCILICYSEDFILSVVFSLCGLFQIAFEAFIFVNGFAWHWW